MFRNYFGCSDFRLVSTESLVNPADVQVNFGASDTTISTGAKTKCLGYGSAAITTLIQSHLQAKYKFFAKNITFEVAEILKLTCCSFEPFNGDSGHRAEL